jgi:hypothetical protein
VPVSHTGRRARRVDLDATPAGAPRRGTGLDRGVEGGGRQAPDRRGLRIPPQRGDLVTLRLGLQAPARLLQVGRDGGDRVAPRPARPVLSGFEAIDRGRRVLEDRTASAVARRRADDLIWEGNVQLLEHEQRALVQPNFDGLSCAFARLVSIGSATRFEVRECGTSSRTSPRSTWPRSDGARQTPSAREHGRESLASMIAGIGSRRASSLASEDSMPTPA